MGSPFPDMINAAQMQLQNNGTLQIGEQGLSPPYSNQSPPHSVQSHLALSPQAYIGK